jgi:hypothetical protein
MQLYLNQAIRLHRHLAAHHWDGAELTGPDSGVRINYRVGRFVKSYLRFLPWRDSHYYLQAQGYWVLANWRLLDATRDATYADCAVAASKRMLERQRPDGAWDYPNPAWAGRIATAEGTWAAIGLIESYRRTGNRSYLGSATAWHDFLERRVGYASIRGGLAVNYFANRNGAAVPNNSAFALRFLGELASATGNREPLGRSAGLVKFLASVQLPSGELPYSVAEPGTRRNSLHFQCFQYNAFQCLDLAAYFETTGDRAVVPIMTRLLDFLRGGVGPHGHPYFDCRKPRRAVVYHAAALGAALAAGKRLGLAAYEDAERRAYAWLLSMQGKDGGFPTSVHDYGVLSDRRSYPRNQAMILLHLLSA